MNDQQKKIAIGAAVGGLVAGVASIVARGGLSSPSGAMISTREPPLHRRLIDIVEYASLKGVAVPMADDVIEMASFIKRRRLPPADTFRATIGSLDRIAGSGRYPVDGDARRLSSEVSRWYAEKARGR